MVMAASKVALGGGLLADGAVAELHAACLTNWMGTSQFFTMLHVKCYGEMCSLQRQTNIHHY
jgi:hypothetical protein